MQKMEEIYIDRNIITRNFNLWVLLNVLCVFVLVCAFIVLIVLSILASPSIIVPPISLYYIGSDICNNLCDIVLSCCNPFCRYWLGLALFLDIFQ